MNIDEVLSRVATVAEAHTDSAIARALELTPQAIGSARKRGTIPYEKICVFAEKNGLSIDYLLLGRAVRHYQTGKGEINLDLLTYIGQRLDEADHQLREEHGIDLLRFVGAEAYLSGDVYNQVLGFSGEESTDEQVSELVEKEISRVVDRRRAEHRWIQEGRIKVRERKDRNGELDKNGAPDD